VASVLLIRRLLGADYLMRPQSGTMQEFAEFVLVERFTDVVQTLFCPRKSKPFSICVIKVFSEERTKPRSAKKDSTSGYLLS
jgi:hypothetical protein